MNILMIYGSLEGQTQKVSEHIASILRNKGHNVTTLSVKQARVHFAPGDVDATIIGGSIHMGKYPAGMKSFVRKQRDWLNSIPSGFYTVCMAVNSQRAESQAAGLQYGEDFLKQTGWQPRLSTTFAGAVRYTHYNIITRLIMKWISGKEGGSTDTSRDHEYTDWQAVEAFASDFLTAIGK